MKRQTLATLMGIGWAACGAGVLTQERPSDPPPSASREVTLKGNVLSNVHLGEKGKSVFLQGLADRTRQHGHFGKGNAGFAISEVEYITSEPGPEKTYPGVIRFRVVVEAAATRRVEGAEKDRPGGPQE